MVRVMRSATIKTADGVPLAQEIAAYLNKKYPQTNTQVFVETFGNFGTVYWISDHENLAALEELGAKIAADEEYLALTLKGFDAYLEGSVKDTLLTALEG